MRVEILGVQFDNVTMAEAVEKGKVMLNEACPHYVVTPNPEIVETCRANAEAMHAVNGADLILPDGIGVIYGAKIQKHPLKERVPGIEFGTAMLKIAAEEGKSVYLLGAKPGIADMAADNMRVMFPDLRIVGTADGYFKDDAAAAAKIRESGAELAFVCLGAPKQEIFMERYGEATGARLLLGLGGSLDVFAGVAERAPQFYCEHGLEWLYRLMKNPQRIGRMMKLPLFLLHAMGEKNGR